MGREEICRKLDILKVLHIEYLEVRRNLNESNNCQTVTPDSFQHAQVTCDLNLATGHLGDFLIL
jgi:hypothetical protein